MKKDQNSLSNQKREQIHCVISVSKGYNYLEYAMEPKRWVSIEIKFSVKVQNQSDEYDVWEVKLPNRSSNLTNLLAIILVSVIVSYGIETKLYKVMLLDTHPLREETEKI